MDRPYFLAGDKIILRPFEESDLDLYYSGKNHPLVRETLFTFAPQTREQVLADIKLQSSNDKTLFFTICCKETLIAAGETAFVRWDAVSRAAIFFLAIYDPQQWKKGFGSEATKLMCEYGFEIINLNRIQLHVACENIAAVKSYEKAGFIIEGTLRQAMYHNDRYCDFYVMGLLRSDYYRGKKR